MTDGSTREIRPGEPAYAEVVEFLHKEAGLLDEGQFSEWLAMLTEDLEYSMPIRVNRLRGKPDHTADGEVICENHASLTLKVKRLTTDFAWAETPPSRTRHMVTNVRVRTMPDPNCLESRSYFLLYRTRSVSTAADILCGERQDVLRRVDGEWRLAKRLILLDQAVISARHLSTFL